MKLCYLTRARLPTEKAYGVQMVSMLEALSKEGLQVTLIGTSHSNRIKESIYDYYSVEKKDFRFVKVKVLNLFAGTQVGFWLNMLSFCFPVLRFLGKDKHDVIFSREPFPLLFLTFSSKKTIFEMHDFPQKGHFLYKYLCKRVDFVITTNSWAAKKCIEEYGLTESKITVLPNGYKEVLAASGSGEKLRKKHKFAADEKVVLYSGHLYDWKGVDTLAKAAGLLKDMKVVFVGGNPDDIDRMKKSYDFKNILFVGHVKPNVVYEYLQMADVLVLPNVPINQHSKYSTSPIKLFEYMSSGKPVVASNLPSILSIVDEKCVTFFEPGDYKQLSQVIRQVLIDPHSATKSARAREFVEQYSWRSRASRIVGLVQS